MVTILIRCRMFVDQLRGFGRDEKGVTTVEYGIMLALVALAVALATPGLSDAVIAVFTDTTAAMTPVVAP